MNNSKMKTVSLLVIAEIFCMSLWFISAAIMPEISAEFDISSTQSALLTSSVQIGFVVGALVMAATALTDRIDPRFLFAFSAMLAAVLNASLLVIDPSSFVAVFIRFATGILLAGIYPVGMKIMIGWGKEDRGLLVGILVGALTLGSALPHLTAILGGSDWRMTITAASAAAFVGGVMVLFSNTGPHHALSPKFTFAAVRLAWSNKHVRYAYGGYLGHMWELYAMWAWLITMLAASFSVTLIEDQSLSYARIITFIAIATGAITCVIAGKIADRIGKSKVAEIAMLISGLSAIAVSLSFGGPWWLTAAFALIWGLSIIPDSAQFSALVADASPPELAGSLMTLQTALGFTLTFFTVQLAPVVANAIGWQMTIALLALGPIFGIFCMRKLQGLQSI